MGVLHENEEWTEVMEILMPLLSMRGWGWRVKDLCRVIVLSRFVGELVILTSFRLRLRKQNSVSTILPLEIDYGFYQPISFFCNLEKNTRMRPLVKRLPSWSSELIFTSSMFRGLICLQNQLYFIA
jgi:hypothetical protein